MIHSQLNKCVQFKTNDDLKINAEYVIKNTGLNLRVKITDEMLVLEYL